MTHNRPGKIAAALLLAIGVLIGVRGVGAEKPAADLSRKSFSAEATADSIAQRLLSASMHALHAGPPLDAKLRQTINIAGQPLVGVGRYQQAGSSSGKFRFELKIPTAAGTCFALQTNDGRLAWMSRKLGEEARIERVDLARLSQKRSGYRLPAIHRVGGLIELLDRIGQDFTLDAVDGRLEDEPVVILRGSLNLAARQRLEQSLGSPQMPDYLPDLVRIALARSSDPEWLVRRIEYVRSGASETPEKLLSVLEVYEVAVGGPVDEQRFQFDADHRNVEILNVTDRYLEASEEMAQRGSVSLR